ncbi:hypothetical protein RRG08_060383 [Elysia crispata]|uniref:Uncharacterized protein n=1 Tax=Elysia crispata TaxID=231223 RepID=A0AAE1DFT4_9GAST|nr:hypothetical protein RRG08_060383 [Elysia crispata]
MHRHADRDAQADKHIDIRRERLTRRQSLNGRGSRTSHKNMTTVITPLVKSSGLFEFSCLHRRLVFPSFYDRQKNELYKHYRVCAVKLKICLPFCWHHWPIINYGNTDNDEKQQTAKGRDNIPLAPHSSPDKRIFDYLSGIMAARSHTPLPLSPEPRSSTDRAHGVLDTVKSSIAPCFRRSVLSRDPSKSVYS